MKSKYSEYQTKYHQAHYKLLAAWLDVDLVKEFKDKLKKNKISVASFLRDAILEYLEQDM